MPIGPSPTGAIRAISTTGTTTTTQVPFFDLIVVGSGLAGYGVLHELANLGFSGSLLWVSSPKQAPPASLFSTAIVARRGLSKGVSPLGDLLWDGLGAFRSWVQREAPEGVETSQNCYLCGPESSPFYGERKKALERRFGKVAKLEGKLSGLGEGHQEEGYLIYPETFFNSWKKKIVGELNVQETQDLVTSLEETPEKVILKSLGGASWHGRCLFLGTGAYSQLYPLSMRSMSEKTKVIPGHYLCWKMDQLKEISPLVLSLGRCNLIARPEDKALILGATSEGDAIMAPRLEFLRSYRDEFNLLFKESPLSLPFPFSLPPLKEARFLTGLRHKGPQRKPRGGKQWEGRGRIYEMNGLYKNGFTLAWALAPTLAKNILEFLPSSNSSS